MSERDPQEWLDVAIRMAEAVDREIERSDSNIDLFWIQDQMRGIVWHCRGATGDPGPRVSVSSQPPRLGGDVSMNDIACHIDGCSVQATVAISGCEGYSALCADHDDELLLADPLCCTSGLASSPFSTFDYAALEGAMS